MDSTPEQAGIEIISALKPGNMLDLQFSVPLPARIKLPLVGYEVGKYLIVKYPDPRKYGSYADVIKSSHVAVARFLVEGNSGECAAFRTTIQTITKVPEHLIFFDYPKQIETRQLRKLPRIQTHIPCEVSTLDDDFSEQDSEQRISGLINDLSADGCKFIFKAVAGIKGVKKRPVKLFFHIPGKEEKASVIAHVRNSRVEDNRISVGIQFSDDKAPVFELMEALMIDLQASF